MIGRYWTIADAFCAFRSQEGTVGDLHLRQLAKAGISHVHLLPSFDFGSVPERPEEQKEPELPSASAAVDICRQGMT